MNEFELIKRYFSNLYTNRDDVVMGVGDDAAVMNFPAGYQFVTATDTLVEGVHFFRSANPYDIAYKTLAVNLSDFAAMSATPAWVTLALTLPVAEEEWLASFAQGLEPLMRANNLALVGGDTTRGPLTISIAISGYAKSNSLFLRSQARVGQAIYVTGSLGGAAAAVALIAANKPYSEALFARHARPMPRNQIAQALSSLSLSTCAIDISDGFLADLQHVLSASGVGATILKTALPIDRHIREFFSEEDALSFALHGGDDYELMFTCDDDIPQASLQNIANEYNCTMTKVGVIESGHQLFIQDEVGQILLLKPMGYQHF